MCLGLGANMRASTEKNILYFYDGLCEPVYSGYFSSEAVCKAFSRCTLSPLKTATLPRSPPNSELQGPLSRMLHTRPRCSLGQPDIRTSFLTLELFSWHNHKDITHFYESLFWEMNSNHRNFCEKGSWSWDRHFFRLCVERIHLVDRPLLLLQALALEAIHVSVDVYTLRSQQSMIKRDLQWSLFTCPWTCTKASLRIQETRVGHTLAV